MDIGGVKTEARSVFPFLKQVERGRRNKRLGVIPSMVVNALKTSYQSELARAAGHVDPTTADSLRREGQVK